MTPRKPNDFAHFCSFPVASLRDGNATTGEGFVSRAKFSSRWLTAGCADHPHCEHNHDQRGHYDRGSSADAVEVHIHFSSSVVFCGGVLSCVQLSVEIARKSTARFCRLASINTKPLENLVQNLSGRSRGSMGSASISTTSRAWRGPTRRNPTSRSLRASMRGQRDAGLRMTASRLQPSSVSSSLRSCAAFMRGSR